MQGLITIQGLSAEELFNQFREIVREEVRAKVAEELDQRLLSAEEACKLFNPKISRTTLYTYVEKGYFKKYSLEGRIWFKQSEILAALKNLKPYRKNVS